MQVVFTKEDGKAKIDDVKNVKPGYFRYLMKYAKAKIATPILLEEVKKRETERLKKLEEVKAKAQEIAKELKEFSIEFQEKADKEHLYGSITDKNIAEKIQEVAKIELKKDQVRLSDNIKTIGKHIVKLHLAEGVEIDIEILVKDQDGNLEIESPEADVAEEKK